jgi:hypothetical protein
MLNKAGRLTLVTTVLSSMPTYHLTVFPLAVWARKKIDKIRRSFPWKGEENANGGHCLVNWPTVCMPKDLGGLGVPDLERFGKNGEMTQNLGWERMCHAKTQIISFSMLPPWSQLAMATKHASSTTIG